MSSNPLMMDYEGGYLLLSGAACGRLLGHCAGLCLQAVGGYLKTAWRLSFKTEMRVRGVLYMRRAIQIDVLPYLTFFTCLLAGLLAKNEILRNSRPLDKK